MKERFAILMMVALAVGVLVPTAHAAFVLELFDGSTTVSVTDGGFGDGNPLQGVIVFDGAINAWIVNVTTGLSKPTFGSATDPQMDLNTVDVTSNAGGTLRITLTDDGFSLPGVSSPTLISEIGGTTAGTVNLAQALLPDQGAPLTVILGPFGPGAFSGSGSTSGLVLGSFSLQEVAVIHHEGAGATSFDASSVVVPVPGAILLGFLGLGVAGLKLRKSV